MSIPDHDNIPYIPGLDLFAAALNEFFQGLDNIADEFEPLFEPVADKIIEMGVGERKQEAAIAAIMLAGKMKAAATILIDATFAELGTNAFTATYLQDSEYDEA